MATQTGLFDQSLHRSHITDIMSENYRSRYESCLFLYQEVQYGKIMYDMFKNEPGYNFSTLGPRLNALHETISRLLNHLKDIFKGFDYYDNCDSVQWFNRSFLHSVAWLDSCTAELGRAIQDTANSISYRRYRSATAISLSQVQNDNKRMRLSEIHIDYPDTFWAIESLVDDYFERIKTSFFPKSFKEYSNLSSPILVLARGQQFSFEPFAVKGKVPIVVYKPKIEGEQADTGEQAGAEKSEPDGESVYERNNNDIYRHIKSNDGREIIDMVDLKRLTPYTEFRTYIKYMIQLSRVVAPRSFPIMIRYSPLLAHELSHAIIRVLDLLLGQYVSWKRKSKNKKFIKGSLNTIKKVHGEAIKDILSHYHSLTETLFVFIYDYIKGVKKANGLSFNEDKEYRSIRAIAPKYSKEILADICGLILGGQSYVYALLHQIMSEFNTLSGDGTAKLNDEISKVMSNPTHPPTIVRIRILLSVCHELGFVKCVERVEEQLKGFFINTSFTGNPDETWSIWKDKWWDSSKVRKVCKSLIVTLINSMALSPLYLNCFKWDHKKPYACYFYEDKLEDFFELMVNDIIDKKILVWDDVGDLEEKLKASGINEILGHFKLRPSDMVNVLFYTLMSDGHKDCGRHRVAWRIALKKL